MKAREIVLIVVAVVTAVLMLFAARTASATEIERGRALYESRCASCHTESVHGRTERVARDFVAVRNWVAQWNANLGLRWEASEIDDVAAYLNFRYYRYPCPPAICKVVSLRGTTR